MFYDDLNNCNKLIREVSFNKEIDNQNKKVAKNNNTFFEPFDKYFVPSMNSYILSKSLNEFQFSESTITEINNCIREIKGILDREIVEKPFEIAHRINELQKQLESEWNDITNRQISERIEKLKTLKLVSNNKIEIQFIISDMQKITKWPLDDNKIKTYNTSIERSSTILNEIKFDSEVESFLKKVAEKNASLLDLNDKILSWIKSENLSGNILLSIRS